MAQYPTSDLPSAYADMVGAMPDLVAETAMALEDVHVKKAPVPFTPDRQVKALLFLAKFGQAMRACAYAGVSFEKVRLHRKANPDYEAAWQQAIEIWRESLESEALRRAIDGWDEPVYQKGELVGTIHRKSERLLELLLKANIPEKFRENIKIEGNVTGGVLVVPKPLTHEEWEAQYGQEEPAPLTIEGSVSPPEG